MDLPRIRSLIGLRSLVLGLAALFFICVTVLLALGRDPSQLGKLAMEIFAVIFAWHANPPQLPAASPVKALVQGQPCPHCGATVEDSLAALRPSAGHLRVVPRPPPKPGTPPILPPVVLLLMLTGCASGRLNETRLLLSTAIQAQSAAAAAFPVLDRQIQTDLANKALTREEAQAALRTYRSGDQRRIQEGIQRTAALLQILAASVATSPRPLAELQAQVQTLLAEPLATLKTERGGQ